MRDRVRRPLLLACALLLLLCVELPAAAQPAGSRLFLPALARAPQARIAYLGAGSSNGGNMVLGIVDLNDRSRSEVRFSAAYRSDVETYAWSPTAPAIAFTEYECDSSVGPAPCYPISLVIAGADGTVRRVSGNYTPPLWSPDGSKIAFASYTTLEVINADGSGRRTVLPRAVDTRQLSWSPDSRQLAFIDSQAEQTLTLVPAAGGAARPLVSNVQSYRWAPTGDLLAVQYLDGGALAFVDPATGASTPADPNGGPLAWSPDGSRLLFEKGSQSSTLFAVGRDGGAARELGVARLGVWSPDGTRVALQPYDSSEPISVVDLRDGSRRTLAASGSIIDWSPDSRALAVWESANGDRTLIVPVDGGEPRVIPGVNQGGGLQWSPDGGWLSLLNRVQTPDNIVGVRLLATTRLGQPLIEVIPGPYDFGIVTSTWLRAQ